jgi:hypothetical protein
MGSRRRVFSVISSLLILAGAGLSVCTLATAAGTGGTVSLTATSDGAVQNLGTKLIGVSRTGGSSGAASVTCHSANGTAVAGTDYTALSQVLTWANGDAAVKYCHVSISDAHPFAGQKAFQVALSGASGAALGSPAQATVTIYGNQAISRFALSATTYSAKQNAGSLTITVDRTGGSSGWAAVAFATANGSAVAGTDYTSKQGELTWANGDAAPKTFTIPISNAKPFTGAKTIAVALAAPQGALLLQGSTSAIITISGDGSTPAQPATGSATLTWSAPTLETNGSPITGLAGFNIYYGNSPTTLTRVVAVNTPSASSYQISSLAAGTWYFAVAAYNEQAEESPRSEVVSKTI